MRSLIITLWLFVIGCNQVSGADDIRFPEETDTGTATDTIDGGSSATDVAPDASAQPETDAGM